MNSDGWKILAFLLLLCWIGMPQGFADVVPISISQQVSVSGSVIACDFLCQTSQIQDPGDSFSFADTNTQLPPKFLAKNGTASDSLQLQDENFPRTASANVAASQFFSFTPTHFDLVLSMNGQLSGNGTLMAGSVSANSQYSLVFDLTSQSLVHVTGGIAGGSQSEWIGSGSLDGQIHLTGPGFQFDQAPSLPTESSFDEVFTLGPGQYTLNAVSALSRDQGYIIDSFSSVDLSLTADFTSAIPEPARVSTVLSVLMVLGLFSLDGTRNTDHAASGCRKPARGTCPPALESFHPRVSPVLE